MGVTGAATAAPSASAAVSTRKARSSRQGAATIWTPSGKAPVDATGAIEFGGHRYFALPMTPATYQSKSPILSPPQASPSLIRITPALSAIGPVNGL
jgi:hypothetical protein